MYAESLMAVRISGDQHIKAIKCLYSYVYCCCETLYKFTEEVNNFQ